MAATEKISVSIGRAELARAKKLADHLGLSLSTFVTAALRDRIEEEARREAARRVLATFATDELASPAEMGALLERWAGGPGEARPGKRRAARPRRGKPSR